MSGRPVRYWTQGSEAENPNPTSLRVLRVLVPMRCWTGGTTSGTNSSPWRRVFPKQVRFQGAEGPAHLALNLLHAAALDFVLIRRISRSNHRPDFDEGDNPSRDLFKTKADVVKFVQEAVADGAKVIQQQGDAGLDNTTKLAGPRLHNLDCPPSSTAASTMASLWSTIVRTT